MWFQTKVLTAIISLSHGDFLSCWCSSNLSETEEDASIEYDIFAAVGWILDYTSLDVRNATNLEFNLIPNSMPKASYAHHRTSLFVKFFANLHCFVPNICEGWFFVNIPKISRPNLIVLQVYVFSTFHLSFFSRNFNPQSRRGTFLFSRSWSACKWIYLTCCRGFLLLLMLLKLPLLARTSVIIILK